MSDFLLEIGCENLPPATIRPAFEQLARDARARLEALRLPFDKIYTTGSPRRIVLIVSGLSAVQTTQSETVTGPPVSKAYDETGKLTRAASGFAKSYGVRATALKRIATERGEYLGFVRKLKSQRAAPLLKKIAPELIQGMKFPKMMRWEDGDVRFARPIRWIVCLLGSTVIRFELAGVKSGNVTHTVPWIRRDRITVKSARQYLQAMRRAGVVLDHDKRYETIKRLATKVADREKLRLVDDPSLLDELTFMLEEPKPLLGQFEKKYLKLPSDVVVTAMKSHQRYLAFEGRRGGLVPKFLTFTDGKAGSPASVRHGNEKVLRARLEDALFYWQEDLKLGMEGLADKLDSIVFIEGLGTLKGKADRICNLSLALAGVLEGENPPEDMIRRAALFAKADLASEMIKDGKEFTLLQGLIGSYYASEANEPDAIVGALREQYLPRFAGDIIPSSRLGVLLSVADRLDTIVGCFLAGLVPTGSQDPYALRRQANGLLRILEARPTVRLDTLIHRATAAYVDSGLADPSAGEPTTKKLVDFFKTRTGAFLKENGIEYDIVGAVSAVAWESPGVALERARAFQDLRGDAAFELLITGAKRVGNILDPSAKLIGAGWEELQEAFAGSGRLGSTAGFDPAGFEDDAEKGLLEAIRAALPRLIQSEERSDGPAILRRLSALGPAIDEYFDRVLVNCPDSELRSNRHGFLAAVFALFSKYADFSNIVEEGKVSVG